MNLVTPESVQKLQTALHEKAKGSPNFRFAECHLEMHPTKTKVVYCKDGKRKGKYPNVKFDFLGYSFRPRLVRNSRANSLFCGFTPAVSPSAMTAMRQAIRDLKLRRQTQLSLQDIARQLNPLLRGWIAYYGRYAPLALHPLLRFVDQTLVAWARRKFKRFQRHTIPASRFISFCTSDCLSGAARRGRFPIFLAKSNQQSELFAGS